MIGIVEENGKGVEVFRIYRIVIFCFVIFMEEGFNTWDVDL